MNAKNNNVVVMTGIDPSGVCNDQTTLLVRDRLVDNGYQVITIHDTKSCTTQNVTVSGHFPLSNIFDEKEQIRQMNELFKAKNRSYTAEDFLGKKPPKRDPKNDHNYLRLSRRRR